MKVGETDDGTTEHRTTAGSRATTTTSAIPTASAISTNRSSSHSNARSGVSSMSINNPRDLREPLARGPSTSALGGKDYRERSPRDTIDGNSGSRSSSSAVGSEFGLLSGPRGVGSSIGSRGLGSSLGNDSRERERDRDRLGGGSTDVLRSDVPRERDRERDSLRDRERDPRDYPRLSEWDRPIDRGGGASMDHRGGNWPLDRDRRVGPGPLLPPPGIGIGYDRDISGRDGMVGGGGRDRDSMLGWERERLGDRDRDRLIDRERDGPRERFDREGSRGSIYNDQGGLSRGLEGPGSRMMMHPNDNRESRFVEREDPRERGYGGMGSRYPPGTFRGGDRGLSSGLGPASGFEEDGGRGGVSNRVYDPSSSSTHLLSSNSQREGHPHRVMSVGDGSGREVGKEGAAGGESRERGSGVQRSSAVASSRGGPETGGKNASSSSSRTPTSSSKPSTSGADHAAKREARDSARDAREKGSPSGRSSGGADATTKGEKHHSASKEDRRSGSNAVERSGGGKGVERSGGGIEGAGASQHKEKTSKSSSSLIKIVTKSHSTHPSSTRPNPSHTTATAATAAAAPSFLSSVLNAPSTLFHTTNNTSTYPPQFSLQPPDGLDESSRLSTMSVGDGQGPTPGSTSNRPNNPSRPKAAWGQGLRRQVVPLYRTCHVYMAISITTFIAMSDTFTTSNIRLLTSRLSPLLMQFLIKHLTQFLSLFISHFHSHFFYHHHYLFCIPSTA